ncbi:MAG: DUF1440 domain-containing protein [Acidobacteriota bacterium]|jgi:uncharacterized membrane protein YagU involved in acid resistance|nr:DUF1440 domain-containing protein [Acidobacteriota bacterium]
MKSRNDTEHLESNPWKGLFAGVVGGLVGSLAMNLYQESISKFIIGEKRSHGAQSFQKGSPDHGAGKMLKEKGKESSEDDAPERLANTISVGLFDHELTLREKQIAGTAFHYAYGTSMGAVYGIAAETSDKATIGAGMPYGFLIWLGADEGVVPLLGLSKSAEDYPFSVHAGACSSHLVYGLTTELVRNAVRKAIE